MKKLKQLCTATTLLLVLSVFTVAGDIHTNVVAPLPPPPASATATEPSEISTSATESAVDVGSATLITEITLNLLQFLSVI